MDRLYYYGAVKIYESIRAELLKQNDITSSPPVIWVTGHSLGGALASMIAHYASVHAVAFSTPPDALFARRLQLTPKKDVSIAHFGHELDPIFMGQCKGKWSPCGLGGYIMQTKCHTGQLCIYKASVSKHPHLPSALDLRLHRIATMITDVIMPRLEVPECRNISEACTDCAEWTFVEK
jgi:lipase ATG15